MAKIKNLLMEVAVMSPRNFVVMEVRGNLLKDERDKAVAKFKNGPFKTVAEVIVSEPPPSFKKIVHAKALKAKQDAAEKVHRAAYLKEKGEWAKNKREKDQKKAKQKAMKEAKKKAEENKRNKEIALKKAQKEAAKKKALAEGKPAPEEKDDEEPPAIVESDPEPEEPEEPEPVETPCEKVSLTAEEKNVKYFKHSVSDVTEKILAQSYLKFSLPESGEFDNVKYTWAKEKVAGDYVKNWILERKLVTPLQDIVPSSWFKEKNKAWQAQCQTWKNKVNEYMSTLAKKAAAKKAKADKKAAAEKKAKAEAEARAKAKAEGKEVPEPKEEEKPAEDEEEEEEEELDFDGIDVFGVEDVVDVGNKVPLFKDFQFEDYALMSLRYQIHLLAHSFAKDCTDEDRQGIPTDHLAFYYQKYFGSPLNFGSFGVADANELLALVNDTVHINSKTKVIGSLVSPDLESNGIFAKITEAARRRRTLLVDMGDESAKLKMKSGAGGGEGGQKRSWEGQQKSYGGGKWGRW